MDFTLDSTRWIKEKASKCSNPFLFYNLKLTQLTNRQLDEDQQASSNIRLRDFRHWQLEDSTTERELSTKTKVRHAEDQPGSENSKKKSSIRLPLSRNELCYDSSGYSLDSGRPGSEARESSSNGSSIVSETGLSPRSSRVGLAFFLFMHWWRDILANWRPPFASLISPNSLEFLFSERIDDDASSGRTHSPTGAPDFTDECHLGWRQIQ